MEKVAKVVDFCTFPVLEKIKLFKMTLFAFLVGNGDMHLKNFSLITRNNKIELSPVYDQINTSILFQKSELDELALPLNGKMRNLTRKDFFTYYARNRLILPEKAIEKIVTTIQDIIPKWKELIEISFLSDEKKNAYWDLVQLRKAAIGL